MINIKQQQILTTAFDLFYHRGFHAVGINEIITQAKVAKKTLYNHFQSKDELIIATLEKHHQAIMQQLQKSLALAVPGKDSILVLFEQLDAWIKGELSTLPAFNGCYFNQAYAEFSAVNPAITSLCLSHKKAFHHLFHEQVNVFEKEPSKQQLLVDWLILLSEGVLTSAHISSQKNSAEQATHYIENLLRFKR